LLAALASPAFAGQFACNALSTKKIDCVEEIRSIVTDRFTTRYPASKYKLVVVSGVAHYPNGAFSGSASVWLSAPGQDSPEVASWAMHHFSSSKPGEDALESEKEAIQGATREVMIKLGMAAPATAKAKAKAYDPGLTFRQCRNVPVEEMETVVKNVCDAGTYGPTNCRDEASGVLRTVNKRVCD
jgi:hypothetical protein